MGSSKSSMIKLVQVGLVLLLLVGALAVLMPSLRRAKELAIQETLNYQWASPGASPAPRYMEAGQSMTAGGEPAPRPPARAIVKSFDAQIDLTPKLSIGTATPESIYEAKFEATILARSPDAGKKQCTLLLPLPPQIISLADLTVTVNGDPSDNVSHEGGYLTWRGHLDAEEDAEIKVRYNAVGKGIYTLEKPPGKIIDLFKTHLVAHRSDIRTLELSLQPNSNERDGDKTVYTWHYERLLVGRPIAIDVLGIAAIDRLGELGWLGPISVLVFGLLITLLALAFRPEQLSAWMLLLIAGCFAGAYPLMYFLQEYVSLPAAIVAAAAGVIVIIAVRAFSLFGMQVGLFGGVFLPAAIMTLTLGAAIYPKPAMQGVLLTIMAILTLVVAMILLPKAQKNLAPAPPLAPPAPPPAEETEKQDQS